MFKSRITATIAQQRMRQLVCVRVCVGGVEITHVHTHAQTIAKKNADTLICKSSVECVCVCELNC